MTLENHIVRRFLTDSDFWMEMLETTFPEEFKTYYSTIKDTPITDFPEQMKSLYSVVCSKDQKAYYITNTVLEKLGMLKLTKTGEHYDWSVFKGIPKGKTTFIFPNNKCLRLFVTEDIIDFIHVEFQFADKKKGTGEVKWVMFYLNRLSGELCEHFQHDDVKAVETFYYALLCFFYLTDNDEIVVPAGKKHGSKNAPDNLLNTLRVPVTIVNSRWNTAVCREEAFGVRGHFRLQPFGEKRSEYKLIFIAPFEKSGYHRRAQKETA